MLAQEILLRAKKCVFTNKSAGALSKIRGDGLDFCEIRPYEAGDDIRKINFSASGKTGELQTNIFNENKQINVVICIMLSGSLHFGSRRLKSELIAEIIALLGCSSIRQHNQTKLVFFNQKQQYEFQLKHTGDVLNMIEKILTWDLLTIQSNFKSLDDYLLQQAKSMVFIIGDFYQQFDFSRIAHKHQANALMVRDKLEENPRFAAELDLVNASDNVSIEANMNKQLALKFNQKLQKLDDQLIDQCMKHGMNIGKLYTHDDAFIKLSQLLH
ncbi:MAG: DUF58 domain-containing protein [Proteobacteria bacterium]|nr:DUF58 domain-containing protein [Pseudomonadota bacterium]